MGASPFVGRREELAWLEPRLAAAFSGEPRVILLSGDPGVGKSQLVRELQRQCQARGFEVLGGRCREHLDLPYLPFTGALLPRLARFAGDEGTAIGRLLGWHTPAADSSPLPAHEETTLFATVTRTAIALAEGRPLLVVVDDLQWADRASLDLFTHLAVEVADAALSRPVAVLLVASFRPGLAGRVASELNRLRREDISDELALGGLDEAEVAEMLRALGVTRPSRVLETQVHRATAGNPLFVENVVHRLRRPGALVERNGELYAATDLDTAGPPEVTDAIAERLRAEAGGAAELLHALACYARPVKLDELTAVIDMDAQTAASELDRTVDDGLTVCDDEGYQFAHPLYARVAYSDSAPSTRRRIHERIAEALEPSPGVALELAHHLLAADAPPARILDHARAAGEEAQAMLAWADAARWYDVAADAAAEQDLGGPVVAELRFNAGVAHQHNMDAGSSRVSLQRAAQAFAAAGDVTRETLALIELVRAELGVAVLGETLDVSRLEQVLEEVAAIDPGLHARGVAQLAEAYWVGGDAQTAAATARRALELGRQERHAGACALAQITLSTIAWMQLDLRGALAGLQAAFEDAGIAEDPWYEGVVLPRIALTQLWLGELDAAATTAEIASERARWIGDRAEQTFALAAVAGVAAVRGDYAAAEAAAAEAWLALRLSRYTWGAAFFLPVLADVRSRLGSTDAAERALDQWQDLDTGPSRFIEDAAWALRQLVRARSGFSVSESLASADAHLQARWPVTLGTVARVATLAELADQTGAVVDLDRIERAVDRAMDHGMVLTEGPMFLLPRIRALVAWLQGRLEEADDRYRDAIAVAERSGMGTEVAAGLLGHARVLEALGRQGDAEDAVARARALAESLGGTEGPAPAAVAQEGTAVILFTDVVGSTRTIEALGDAAYRRRAGALDARVRTAVRECGGRPEEGITLGDGVVALFGSARGALECAIHAHAFARETDLEIRVGIHAGDVSRSVTGIYGGAIHVSARVCDLAGPNETLASETVRGLARTSADVAFVDRGLHELKGVREPVHLYAVTVQHAT